MEAVLMMIEAVGSTVGSVAAAGLLCWLLWNLFRIVRHPEWASLAVLTLLALALFGKLPRSEFLTMVTMFTLVAAVPIWLAGRAWRRDHSYKPMRSSDQSVLG